MPKQCAVILRECADKFRNDAVEFFAAPAVDHARKGELAEIFTLMRDGRKALAQIGDCRLLGIVDQLICRAFVFAQAQVAHERGFGIMEMTAAAMDQLAGLAVVDGVPLCDHGEAGFNLQQVAQDERPCLRRRVFERQYFEVLVTGTEMAAIGLDLGIAELNIQSLR
jgi:hypothetical protein